MSDSTTTIVQIDVEGELQKIIAQLNSLPDQLKAPDVLARAINASANEMKRKMGQKVRKRYAVTDKRSLTDKSRGAMYLERANGATTSAALISKGAMQDVMAYMTRKNEGGTAAMLKVLNESQLTALEVDGRKAFEAVFDSGHAAIVRRLGNDRLPIYTLLSPAVPGLYGVVYENEEMDYYAILQKHIKRQVERTLERSAA